MFAFAVIEDAIFSLRRTTCSYFTATHTHVASRTTQLAFFFFNAQLDVVILNYVPYTHRHNLSNIKAHSPYNKDYHLLDKQNHATL